MYSHYQEVRHEDPTEQKDEEEEETKTPKIQRLSDNEEDSDVGDSISFKDFLVVCQYSAKSDSGARPEAFRYTPNTGINWQEKITMKN